MKRTSKQLQRTAIHEAGHAVIGRVLKQVCRQATIARNEQDGEAGHGIIADSYDTLIWWEAIGRIRGSHESYSIMRARISIMRGRIMAFMAGRAAEEEFFGRCAGGDDDDCRQIDFMLDDMLPADADVPRYAGRLRARTRGLVRRHRAKIERVAALLVERKTLEAEEIERAMTLRRRRRERA